MFWECRKWDLTRNSLMLNFRPSAQDHRPRFFRLPLRRVRGRAASAVRPPNRPAPIERQGERVSRWLFIDLKSRDRKFRVTSSASPWIEGRDYRRLWFRGERAVLKCIRAYFDLGRGVPTATHVAFSCCQTLSPADSEFLSTADEPWPSARNAAAAFLHSRRVL